jgi:hypothetical protein
MEDLPIGWRMIASVVANIAMRDNAGVILRFGCVAGELLVDDQSKEERLSGAIACARALAIRTDPMTGGMWIPPDGGPVDRKTPMD